MKYDKSDAMGQNVTAAMKSLKAQPEHRQNTPLLNGTSVRSGCIIDLECVPSLHVGRIHDLYPKIYGSLQN